jgi:hypothetical protein
LYIEHDLSGRYEDDVGSYGLEGSLYVCISNAGSAEHQLVRLFTEYK